MAKTRYNTATRDLERWDEVNKKWLVEAKSIISNEAAAELKEAARAGTKVSATVESYKLMGLSEAEARIAAGVERGVKTGNINTLFESALALGLSEAEAKIFADPKAEPTRGVGDLFKK